MQAPLAPGIGATVSHREHERKAHINTDSRVDIMVLGVCNKDMIAYLPRFPEPGETMHGDSYEEGFGGKGANQAVMASKLARLDGLSVGIISKLGEDDIGGDTRVNFSEQGVCQDFLFSTDKAYSGAAMIWVDQTSGSNQIVIVGGTNKWLSEEEIWRCGDAINASSVFVCQLELPLMKNKVALQVAKNYGRELVSDIHGAESYVQKACPVTILNPSPSPKDAIEIVSSLEFVDILVPNEIELAQITHGLPTNTMDEAVHACQCAMNPAINENVERWMQESHNSKNNVRYVVCTLGGRGALIVERDGDYVYIPCEQVTPVDTTGAGDCFLGAFTYMVAKRLRELRDRDPNGEWCYDEKLSLRMLQEATEFGVAAATLSVLEKGTQSSYPQMKDIQAGMKYYDDDRRGS